MDYNLFGDIFDGGLFLLLSFGNIGATIFLVMTLVRINKEWNLEAKQDLNNSTNLENDGE